MPPFRTQKPNACRLLASGSWLQKRRLRPSRRICEGLDISEFAAIPSLPNIADWDAFEMALQKLLPNLWHAHSAAPYRAQLSTQQPTPSHGGNSGKRGR